MALHTLTSVLRTPLPYHRVPAFVVPYVQPIKRQFRPPQTRPRLICSSAPRHPRVLIEFCPGCRWGLRAGWIAQELLVTFETDLGEVAIRPSKTSGAFDVWVDDIRVWCRSDMGRFPELKEVKRAVRDLVDPGKHLGHSDR